MVALCRLGLHRRRYAPIERHYGPIVWPCWRWDCSRCGEGDGTISIPVWVDWKARRTANG